MPYKAKKPKGASGLSEIIVSDNIIDETYYDSYNTIGIQLPGRNCVNYGNSIAQNTIQMVSNFAGTAIPNDSIALQGQLWFNVTNATTGNLYIRKASSSTGGLSANWERVVTIGSTETGTTPVTNPSTTPKIGDIRIIDGNISMYSSVSAGWVRLAGSGSGTGSVTSVAISGGSTGLTTTGSPITTSGTIILGGTLAVANGGTGVTTSTGSGANVLSISPLFTGTPGSPTAPVGTNTTQLATTAFVAAAVSASTAGVSSFSAGSTGLTPNIGTTGIVTLGGTLSVANGGTGATTSTSAFNALVPTQTGNAGKFLTTNGTNTSWATVSGGGGAGSVTSVGMSVPAFLSVTGSPITSSGTLAVSLSGTALPVANGGTGVTTSTGSGANVQATSPTLVTPALGTPSVLVGTNISGTATGFTVGNLNGYTVATTPSAGQTLTPIKTGATTFALQTTTLSTSAPSGGSAGDVWYRYAQD